MLQGLIPEGMAKMTPDEAVKNVEDINKNKPHFNVMAICLARSYDDVELNTEICGHRWIGTVIAETSLFSLECPACGSQNSFVSFLPQDYLESE